MKNRNQYKCTRGHTTSKLGLARQKKDEKHKQTTRNEKGNINTEGFVRIKILM